ncbi:SidA/IucD/PvdA family monooxygenase [Streptomyces sp. NPDC057963]|uniref:SidA/IucD/PvdA family monooxygenase n=1 Tax=Streptomyces sp. NPDC057963 TaxID=3346290 RepID=UPI0036ECCC7A
MQMPGTDIENHSVQYLATLRGPQIRFAFIGSPHEHGQLLAYLNLSVHVVLRSDFAPYVHRGAEERSGMAHFGHAVVDASGAAGPAPLLRGHRCWYQPLI